MTKTQQTQHQRNQFIVRLSEAHHRKVRIIAASRGVTMSKVVQELIDTLSGPGDIDLFLRQVSRKEGK